MQTMNTNAQVFYGNSAPSHQNSNNSYPTNQDPRGYVQGVPQQYYNPNVSYGTQIYTSPYPPNSQFGPRGVNPSYPVMRQPNELSNGGQPFYHQQQQYPGYSTNNIHVQAMYPSPYPPYQVPSHYPSVSVPTPISNQTPSQYSTTNSQLTTQSSQPAQQSSDQSHIPPPQTANSKDRREKKPLIIRDPASLKTVEVSKQTSPATIPSTTNDENPPQESVTDSTNSNSKSSNDNSKTKQEQFRKDFAQLINSNSPTEKNTNQTLTTETTTLTKENQSEDVIPQSTSSSRPSSRSASISNKSSEQLQPGYPGIRTGSITEDKSTNQEDQNNPEKQTEISTDDSKSTSNDTIDNSQAETTDNSQVETIDNSQIETTETVDNVETTESNDTETESTTNLGKTPSLSKRRDYTIEELRNKRSDPVSQERPRQLPEIPGVTTPRQPKPKADGDDRFVRDVRSILNKLTPQTYDKLLEQLNALELNSSKRLEGMITVIFVKAVEAAIFCSLYAKLCKHFEKKQVTVPNEVGQPVTHFFRQILLTRCQKEFESDYREEIQYEKRKLEVDAITDEKLQREAQENLEEDLIKAKRKNLGNIIFIGELFKLRMLTETIMYDCIVYLLRDKTDEENLECLCRLLRTMGRELEAKANERADAKRNFEKNFVELYNITESRQTSARIKFMIQDLLEQRKANWNARRAEIKPTTIDEIHENERIKREEQERERNTRRDSNRPGGNNNPPLYTGSHGSRGSGIKQQSNRNDNERTDNRAVVNSIRQIQTNDKRNAGPLTLNFTPQGAWSKGSSFDKKTEVDRSSAGRTGKPPVGMNQSSRSKTGTPPGTPSAYGVQRQPSRELARENSQRDRENAMESLRKTTSKTEPTSPKPFYRTDSHEGSRNVSREQSRNPSPDSSVNEKISPPIKSSTTTTTTTADTFDEGKVQTRVQSLIEEYTENYSDNNQKPVNEAIEDLESFCTKITEQQGIIVRELFTGVLEAKPRARKAIGHLLNAALQKQIISNEGFLSGIKLIIEVVPDYAVDIPLIWQYIGEILGAFIGTPSSNMNLLEPTLKLIPDNKSKQLFRDIIRYAVEFSSKTDIQKSWQSSKTSLNSLFKPDFIDSSFLNEYNWLYEATPTTPPPPTTTKENLSPSADPQLVKSFKSINDPDTSNTDEQIIKYIHENMNSDDKFYIRKIVLSYLEACLIIRESQKKIQEDIAKKRMKVLTTIIGDKSENQIEAVYAIQNFVHKLEHPQKMAQLLFDMFYDEECVAEEVFFEWRNLPDPLKNEGHSVVEMSTQEFFKWLQQGEEEEGEEEEEEE